MGHGHFSPSGTTGRFREIIDYKGNHVEPINVDQTDIDGFVARERHRIRTDRIRDHFTENYSFKEKDKWLNDHEKLLATTRSGAQLRQIMHPSGTSIYYYIVVEKDIHEPGMENLALKHMQTYYKDLKQLLAKNYGDIYRKTSAWTSEKIEVEA